MIAGSSNLTKAKIIMEKYYLSSVSILNLRTVQVFLFTGARLPTSPLAVCTQTLIISRAKGISFIHNISYTRPIYTTNHIFNKPTL